LSQGIGQISGAGSFFCTGGGGVALKYQASVPTTRYV